MKKNRHWLFPGEAGVWHTLAFLPAARCLCKEVKNIWVVAEAETEETEETKEINSSSKKLVSHSSD